MLRGQIAQALPFLQANRHDFAFGRNRRGRLERQERRQGQSDKSAPPASPEESALLLLVNHVAAVIIHPLPGSLSKFEAGS
jgi:hypothetical protein